MFSIFATKRKIMLEQFRNKVFNQDVIETLKQLPDNCLDVVYGDPDYNVGINYAGKNYTQKWNDYIDWYIELTKESMRVLKPTGSLFMMNYPKQNAYLRVKYLDENAFDVQDYVWVYNTNVGHSPRRFTTAHRSILHATKSKDNNFYKDNVAVPYQNPTDKRIKQRMAEGHLGRMPYSWFYFDLVKNVSKDKTFHSCQIPLGLVEMLIKSCTQQNDDVFILFGGSGSEIVLCKELKRNFISCELHPEYYEMIQDRLANNGKISEEYRLEFVQEKKKTSIEVSPKLFDFETKNNGTQHWLGEKRG
jgi:site-specific DNA-methyltransferase (adenine-specific)